MKSLILTSLYLFKDTLYRWKERPSSPLSRLLVVFFLSLCALSFLSNYVLSTKMIRDRIRLSGGDLVVMMDMETDQTMSKVKLVKEGLSRLCDHELIILDEVGTQGEIDSVKFPIVEYSDDSLSGLTNLPLDLFPYLVLLPADSTIREGPAVLGIMGYTYEITARRIPPGHILERGYEQGVVLVPQGTSRAVHRSSLTRRYFIRINDMSYRNVKMVDQTLRNVCRMDGSFSSIMSSEKFLAELDIILGNQQETRAGFSIGIAVIVGILLTALASMEFRENEYVYTLMKSFGVRPIYLVTAFILENMFLVGLAFAASLAFFMEAQKIIMTEFFKLGQVLLSVADLKDDIVLLSFSLMICVLVSSIPIGISAYREIGRILK